MFIIRMAGFMMPERHWFSTGIPPRRLVSGRESRSFWRDEKRRRKFNFQIKIKLDRKSCHKGKVVKMTHRKMQICSVSLNHISTQKKGIMGFNIRSLVSVLICSTTETILRQPRTTRDSLETDKDNRDNLETDKRQSWDKQWQQETILRQTRTTE